MSKVLRRIPLRGSNRNAIPEATLIGKADPAEKITVSIYLRRNPAPPATILARMETFSTELPGKRQYLNEKEFNEVYGAGSKDMDTLGAWAKTHNLTIVEKNIAQKRVKVEGAISDINAAFDTELNEYTHPHFGKFRGRVGQIAVSEDVYGIIEGVFGLDNRHLGHSHLRRKNISPVEWKTLAAKIAKDKSVTLANLSNQWPGTFFPVDVAKLYDYPTSYNGTGQNVAIFAFNGLSPQEPRGGYSLPALKIYFEKVLGQKTPSITDVVIQGKGNNPGPDSQASSQNGDSTGEVMLDMCVVGSVAPGAHIFMYFTEFNSKGWVDALHDAIAGKNNISVISISYGNPEKDKNSAWTQMAVNVVNQAFEAAKAKGITICCASGDDGSGDGSTTTAEVDFPASSPYVMGIGGTKLVATKTTPSAIASETVWNEVAQNEGAGGGGISVLFTKPDYQNSVSIPPSANPPHKVGRGVPDAAAVADPETGVVIMHVGGKSLEPIGGTSAAAPLWAALVARLNHGLNAKCGFLNTLLYTKFSTGVLRDITKGNNGAYNAQQGWDACTGLGAPEGTKLLHALSGK